MEKICIVRRRKNRELGSERVNNRSSFGELISYESAMKENAFQFHNSYSVHCNDDMPLTDSKNDVAFIKPTREQTVGSRSSNFALHPTHGISLSMALEVESIADDGITIHFHFEKKNTLSLLKTQHVCEMLQISGSTLSKLVKIKKIRSLKLGRLRRFSVDDISAYLAAHED